MAASLCHHRDVFLTLEKFELLKYATFFYLTFLQLFAPLYMEGLLLAELFLDRFVNYLGNIAVVSGTNF